MLFDELRWRLWYKEDKMYEEADLIRRVIEGGSARVMDRKDGTLVLFGNRLKENEEECRRLREHKLQLEKEWKTKYQLQEEWKNYYPPNYLILPKRDRYSRSVVIANNVWWNGEEYIPWEKAQEKQEQISGNPFLVKLLYEGIEENTPEQIKKIYETLKKWYKWDYCWHKWQWNKH